MARCVRVKDLGAWEMAPRSLEGLEVILAGKVEDDEKQERSFKGHDANSYRRLLRIYSQCDVSEMSA